MPVLPIPPDEADRLAVLRAYAILDTPPEEAFDRLARLATVIFDAPIALVSLLDEHRQWFKARVGLGAAAIPREGAFCAQTILADEIMHVPDASKDPRFAGNPLVATDPGVRFYAGAPLKVPGGQRLGTVCVIDTRPRPLGERQRRALHDLAALAADQLELRRVGREALEARRRAEQATRVKADFLAVMSHEIRTPLTGVLGMADLLAAAALPARERRQAEAIRASGRHLLAVLNDVLDFSRIEAGGLALEQVGFSLAEVLERVRSLLAPLAVERGLELRAACDASVPPVVLGDPTRLQQVLLNLVGNALKFTPAGSVVVRVGGRPDGAGRGRWRFEVRDTGIGIPCDQQATLFAAFTQAEPSIARRYGGTGLGLAICRRLVEAMGGAIGLESAPGEGSLFWFEVPFGVGGAAVAADATAMTPRRVLLAEDVAVNRELLVEMLGRHGHEVVCAADGVEAVTLAARERFDVILMDVRMPGMDGVEATRRIRGLDGPARAVPIVALTADAREEERRRCLAAGMDGCLAKPLAWPELHAVLKEAAAPPATERTPAPEAGMSGATPANTDAGSADLRWRFLEDAKQSCELLRASPPPTEELLEQAHQLKGTAGLLGLGRIAAAAGAVQAVARANRATAEAVEVLASAVTEAHEEVRERGLLRRLDGR